MSIKAVPANEAPSQLSGRSGSNSDYQDVLAAIKNPATNPVAKACAIVVDMSDPGWSKFREDGKTPKYAKPEQAFAFMLRRYFAAQKLPLTAYHSGKMQVTVKKTR